MIALQGGLNHQELSLIHHQSRLHEDTLRRAAAERQSLATGLSGLPGVPSLGDPLNSINLTEFVPWNCKIGKIIHSK